VASPKREVNWFLAFWLEEFEELLFKYRARSGLAEPGGSSLPSLTARFRPIQSPDGSHRRTSTHQRNLEGRTTDLIGLETVPSVDLEGPLKTDLRAFTSLNDARVRLRAISPFA
jgi:hypothetical protein